MDFLKYAHQFGKEKHGCDHMLVVIANPTAHSGKAASVIDAVCQLLKKRGLAYRCDTTQYVGHAMRLADSAFHEGADGIVCVGGDGTVNEIISGLAGRHMTLYLVPCGTGNDFVKVLPLPKDPLKALECQLDSPACPVDIGQVNDRYFLNIAGTGFDVEVLRQTMRFKWLGGGLLPYLCGVVAALRRFKPMDIELTINGKTEKRRVTIISIGNGQYLGGGMRAVPQADPMDGLFDVIYVDAVNRRTIARLLPHFIKGTHTGLPIAHCARCTEVVINSPGMTFNLDGELHDMDRAFCRMLPGALTLHLPDEDEPAERR